ncbi:hypothetical protein GALL_331710 [mine drainage metagenome]|uniref:Uncharacterized protein n=1 Tax=mine drainage metagenome TaxID=410659 RepID=A0A1J5QNM5_9ZZZZ
MSKTLQARLARLEQRQKAADGAPEPIDRIVIVGMTRAGEAEDPDDLDNIVIDIKPPRHEVVR